MFIKNTNKGRGSHSHPAFYTLIRASDPIGERERRLNDTQTLNESIQFYSYVHVGRDVGNERMYDVANHRLKVLQHSIRQAELIKRSYSALF